jgi:hypothetical protein
MKLNKRTFNFLHTDISLTSRRVSIILSNITDSSALADSVRKSRHESSEDVPFSISEKTRIILAKEKKSVLSH